MTEPILSGSVRPEGIDWTPSALFPSEMFWRQLHFGEFDISEMSLSSLTIAAAQGVQDWVALPVFTTRRFFHTGIVVRSGAGINAPEDLKGKRVGVPEYQQTAAVWSRGALLHEFGVVPQDIKWFMERQPSRSHGGATGFAPPPGVTLEYITPNSSIAAMLAAGELDAALVYISNRNLIDRSTRRADSIAALRPLFSDPIEEGERYYATTRILPVNHAVVIRKKLLDQHPWVALNVFTAFLDAKRSALGPLIQREWELGSGGGLLESWLQIGAISPESFAAIENVDPLPYGLSNQHHVLDTLSSYICEQGLTEQRVDMPSLFAPSTRDL